MNAWWRHCASILGFAAVAAAPASSFFLLVALRVDPMPFAPASPRPPIIVATPPAERVPVVWQVEKTADSDTYSNGLRIDNRFVVASRARSYLAFPVDGAQPAIRSFRPAGIVFHTTESQQAPFEADENGHLKRIAESAVAYVSRNRSYNFLIDRFGRVYRIVAENEVANHAGSSVWSDERWLYLNLNESFLGVSFEAETRPAQTQAATNPAQIHSAAMLVDMLRSQYGIPAGNCVTHGQVSVNSSNMRIGYHTDWASSFPFEELGLPDNYSQALPAIWAFGFEADAEFLRTGGSRMSTGVDLARQRMEYEAAGAGLPLVLYRKRLQRRYREKLAGSTGGAAAICAGCADRPNRQP